MVRKRQWRTLVKNSSADFVPTLGKVMLPSAGPSPSQGHDPSLQGTNLGDGGRWLTLEKAHCGELASVGQPQSPSQWL